MGKNSMVPDLFDDCKTVSINKLKDWGYLQSFTFKSGTITWSRRGEQTGSIGIILNIGESSGTISFNYNFNKEPINYKVQIISKDSNLGKGLLWFFVCPNTGKHCRILHLGQKYFLHRSAFSGYIYESQTWSKSTRYLFKTLYKDVLNEKHYEEIYSNHFKKTYRGKPTRRYLRLMKKIYN